MNSILNAINTILVCHIEAVCFSAFMRQMTGLKWRERSCVHNSSYNYKLLQHWGTVLVSQDWLIPCLSHLTWFIIYKKSSLETAELIIFKHHLSTGMRWPLCSLGPKWIPPPYFKTTLALELSLLSSSHEKHTYLLIRSANGKQTPHYIKVT